ncbi:metallophosphoesterase [Paenibacillus eucommiae]|uniref:MPP superfamily phosphohydrolase n=1 Tax=Paenibacillus eucommiae TaxID=1355755 RepID=A0ABS4J625_9BACL|nr:metallophosphoesterase [Paenibacillus eucommiae]MBP1995273.1 putative MPP superfamily phosphohydrolase [Paenibacillus eucommiae]
MKQKNLTTRRSFLQKSIYAAAGLLIAGGLTGGYSTLIEPRWYETTYTRLVFDRLPAAFRGVRIVHFSDVHLGYHFDNSNLRTLIDRIMKEKPDLICFTGDLFDQEVGENPSKVSELLAQLKAPLGKWACLGNHDYYSGYQETISVLQAGGFTTLLNEHQYISKGDQAIQIVGVDDMSVGRPDIKRAMKDTDPDAFSLLLSHSSNYADAAAPYSLDLQLSGHSHGGQIRLPLIGALVLPPHGNKYAMGHYQADNSKLQIYTTRGIGTTIFPLRFLCRPEITVLTLNSSLS